MCRKDNSGQTNHPVEDTEQFQFPYPLSSVDHLLRVVDKLHFYLSRAYKTHYPAWKAYAEAYTKGERFSPSYPPILPYFPPFPPVLWCINRALGDIVTIYRQNRLSNETLAQLIQQLAAIGEQAALTETIELAATETLVQTILTLLQETLKKAQPEVQQEVDKIYINGEQAAATETIKLATLKMLAQTMPTLLQGALENAQAEIQQEVDKTLKNDVETISDNMGVEDGRAVKPTDKQGATKEAAKQLSKAQLWQTIDATLQQAEANKNYLLGSNSKLRERRYIALQAFLSENTSFKQIGEKIGLTKEGVHGTVQRGLELVFPSLPEKITQEYVSAEDLYKQLIQGQNNRGQIHSQRTKDGIERSRQSGQERKPRGKDIQPRRKREKREKSEREIQQLKQANLERWRRYKEEGKPAFSEQGLANIQAGRKRSRETQHTTLVQAEHTVVDLPKLQSQQRKPQE